MRWPDGVLFDMDGTLVDSDAAVARAWRRWAEEAGVDPAAALAGAAGVPAPTTVRALLPGADEASVARLAARQLALQYDDLHDVVPTRGAHELLRFLDGHGVPWAVVTSADRTLALARLGAASIVAPVLVTASEIVHGKPDPSGYRRAAQLLDVDVRRCLVVEDAAAGVAAGRAAGAITVGVRGIDADVPVHDLVELCARLMAARPPA